MNSDDEEVTGYSIKSKPYNRSEYGISKPFFNHERRFFDEKGKEVILIHLYIKENDER